MSNKKFIDHQGFAEHSRKLHEQMPNFIYMIIYFSWDEGQYALQIKRINKDIEELIIQLSDSGNDELQKKLDVLFEEQKTLYHILVSSVSEEEMQIFKIWHDKLFI